MSAEDPALSKSARKRANKKARDAEGGDEEEAPEPAPAPAPKAKAKAKAEAAAEKPAEPKAKAKGKAKAEPKKAAEPAPAAPKSEAKAKAKGKAKAAPPAEEPKPEPKAAAKTAAKSKAKAKAAKPEAEPEEAVSDLKARVEYTTIDDGSRADEWAVSSGLSKKANRRKEVLDERKVMEQAQRSGAVIAARGNQHIPGLAPVDVQVAQAKGAAKKGGASQAVGAVAKVSAFTSTAPQLAAAAAPNTDTSATVKVPETKIGRVVGPKGANVNLIKEKTGVKSIDMSDGMCTILGTPDAVALAEHAVRQLVEKGYMSLAYEDFEEEGVAVYPNLFPDIIGQKGAIIQEIKKQAKVEVDIPPVPKNGPAGKKYKVMLAGSKAGVALGKEIITSIAMYGHHELTHPGQAHKEMEIEEWRYRYLIGTKGSEMRHIQNNYKVKVNIPREYSMNEHVVIVGEPRDIDRAVKYIEKVMYEADQPKGRGAADQSIDDGADTGEVEEWMRPYMYQRK